MASEQISVTPSGKGLLIEANLFQEAQGWSATPVDEKRVLLASEEGKQGMSQAPSGLASCSVEVFRDFLLSLHQAGWSGSVAIDTGYGPKKVFFERGSIVFAASTVIDDRLGEVIYREAKISLDELTNSAAQVTKSRKFGQVLLASGIFSNVQLWDALKLQVRQILRSLFMINRVYFELTDGHGLAPTEVVFPEPQSELIGDCFSFGAAFRGFLKRLRAESVVELTQPFETIKEKHGPGTFVGDLVDLINAESNVQELLNTSKLTDNYTVSALLNLVNMGLARVTPEVEEGRRVASHIAPVKAKLDAYGYVLSLVRKAFGEASREFPIVDLQNFAAQLNPPGFPSLYIDTEGVLSRESINGVFAQCAGNASRVGYYVVRVESLIQFLLQVAGDNLDFQAAKRIRQEHRSIVA